MYVMLLGAPGVGKGTQAKKIMKERSVPQISTGDILRAAIKAGTPLGLQVKAIMDSGELVSDDLILQIVEERLKQPDCANGFILDGFPRTIPQAQGLQTILEKLNGICLRVIEISVPDDEVIRRLTSRRSCSNCGTLYSLLSHPQLTVCENCNSSDIVQRDDDREETIRHRLEVYRRSTQPLIEFYREKGGFVRINGSRSPEAVFEEIQQSLT